MKLFMVLIVTMEYTGTVPRFLILFISKNKQTNKIDQKNPNQNKKTLKPLKNPTKLNQTKPPQKLSKLLN